MTAADLTIRRAGDESRAHVLELLAEHLPGSDVAARHRWLYEQNPHGRALTMIGYDSTGTPAGITSVFPRRVMVRGEERLGSMGGDGYVRPAFRRRGLATALHHACLSAMREDGIEFMFGPPEPYNLRALLKAGSRIVTDVRRFVRPRPAQRLSRLVTRLLGRSEATLSAIGEHDRRVADVWEEVAASKAVVPVRDAAHWAWRYAASPSRAQHAYAVVRGPRTIAVCALERRGDRAAIVDLMAPADRFAEAARAVAGACGAEAVETQLNPRGPGGDALARAGFFGRQQKPFQVLAPGAAPEALFDPDAWFYTWGDGDVDEVL